MFDLQNALGEVSDALQERMEALLPHPDTEEDIVIPLRPVEVASGPCLGYSESEAKIIEAMRYAALGGGKRLRPFLTVTCAEIFGVSREASLTAAAAIEFLHTYSLIHDDLPAMDDDDLRRGQPSCHIKFGEAAAILAGDALLTYCFELLASDMVHTNPAVRCELIAAVAKAGGFQGMVGGQMMDLDAENEELEADEVIRLQRLKTGELFAVSCEAGAILGKAPRPMCNALHRYAHDIGLAFQITDDLLDAEGKREEVGKEVDKDKAAGKATLVSVLGIEEARERAYILAEQATQHLDAFGKEANRLRVLAQFVITRKS
jgi:farnesyl diphosphate synthase